MHICDRPMAADKSLSGGRVREADPLETEVMERILKNEDGVSAVEFALVLPILLLILLGILEFGLILFTYNSTQNVSRDVARQLATNRIAVTSADAQARSELPSWIASKATVVVTQSDPANARKNVFVVDVSFKAPDAVASSFLSFAYGSLVLHGKVSIQQEYT